MNTCTTPFNITIGNLISHQLTSILLSLFGDDIKIIDRAKFVEKYNYEPCISSKFMVTNGGSCSFIKKGYTITTHNGTLCHIAELPQIIQFMSAYP
jgi:hypothetical protein